MGNEKGLTGGTEACGCGWKRPLIGITTLEGTLPPERVVPVYNCPCCGTFYVPVELSEEAAASVFANLMSTAQPLERRESLGEKAVPIIDDFMLGLEREAGYQRERWGKDPDVGKEPADWFWLLGYLAGKALASLLKGDRDKALHHTISTAAACANWHAAIKGTDTRMRPGIEPPAGSALAADKYTLLEQLRMTASALEKAIAGRPPSAETAEYDAIIANAESLIARVTT